ncbi:MAG: YggS family pyridoxal phosphate-dependent enzyme [Acholeplasmataceae bacterium]|nr:MAG: YggS family pyridoxal phosphate-dependent enzyme [Acholeplasmataceae bacterium]
MNMIKQPPVTICASKYFTVDQIRQLHQQGVRHFGENRAQELIAKQESLAGLDITWHFIGHLQSNKVKDIINRIDLLHTLDRAKLAKEIQKHAERPVNCLIQVNMTDEPQKSGVFPANLADFIVDMQKYDKIKIIGLMTMGKEHDDVVTETAFKGLAAHAARHQLDVLSMGMTDDYELAIRHGATHLRIGRKFLEMLDQEEPHGAFQQR